MKKNFFAILFLMAWGICAANDRQIVKAETDRVTVFLNRAQIFSHVQSQVSPELTEILIEQLPTNIDPQSIQVSGKGNFTIMSVKHSLSYTEPQKNLKEVALLQDSIDKYQFRADLLKSEKEVLQKEEQLLLANQSIRGEQTGVSSEELRKMAEFFRKRMLEIRTACIKIDRDLKKQSEKVQSFQNQLNQLTHRKNQPSSHIVVAVLAEAKTTARLDFNYLVADAGWTPVYDLRAKDSKSPVQLGFKAMVFQSTGYNWEDVKLTLSTSNPTLSGLKPVLSSTYLNFYEPVIRDGYGASPKKKTEAPAYQSKARAQQPMMEMEGKEEADALSLADFTEVRETALNTEYEVALPYSIPTGNLGQLVDIRKYELPALYRHAAVPKLDKDAFLLAMISGWEELSLVSGKANLYFEGTYISETYLDLNSTRDTIDISLGRDSKVIIERKSLKEFRSTKLIGTNRKDEYAYEISVRNTKKEPVVISLEDQIPVSRNSMIEVELTDAGGAQVEEASGKLTWKVDLQGQETKKLVFRYAIKYPKGKVLREEY